MDGVVNVVPLPKATPPVGLANQLIVPELALADKLSVPEPHREALVTPVIVGAVLIVATTNVRVALVHEPRTDST
jgi:hypothetical protein